MAGRDRTPSLRRPKVLPRETCPHCQKPVDVMPSGLFALHKVKGRWKASMCRGSGERAITKK